MLLIFPDVPQVRVSVRRDENPLGTGGDVQGVIQALRNLGGIHPSDLLSVARAGRSLLVPNGIQETGATATVGGLPRGRWSAALAADFAVCLDPVSKRAVFHVWRAGRPGIHRQTLCGRTGLTPANIRSLLIQMWHTMQRFQRERGMTLSRPVLSNSRRQRYLIDSNFAVAASSDMFGERMPG